MNQDVETLWEDDALTTSHQGEGSGPDTELAIVLLAAGCTQSYVRHKCRFETQRAIQSFARDEEVRAAVKELAAERVQRLGKLATVGLEQILRTPQTDLRAQVLAIRTALEVSGDLKRDHSPPAKTVRELSVGELAELINATKAELNARISRQRADRTIAHGTTAAESKG
jgi:hypothetical protein